MDSSIHYWNTCSALTGKYARKLFIKVISHINIGRYCRAISGNQLSNTWSNFCSLVGILPGLDLTT